MSKSPEKNPVNVELLNRVAAIIAGVRGYHNHSTVGLEKIPKGAVLIAANHSLASYDIMLMAASIYDHSNRVPRALIDRLFFKVPGLGHFMEAIGTQMGNHDNAVKMLADGEILILAPGGMRESLRPSSEKYKVIWDHRKGFARLALETNTPIVLAACPAADDLFDVAPSHITAWAYRTFKIPLFFAKGLGLTPIPKPVTLTHYLSDPIYPPKASKDPEVFTKQVDQFHLELVVKMEKLMSDSAKLCLAKS